MDKKNPQFQIRLSLIDLHEIFLMKPSEYEISHSVKSSDETTSENYLNFYDSEKHMIFKLSKISNTNFESKILIFDSTLCQNFREFINSDDCIGKITSTSIGLQPVFTKQMI